ncbi:hypothetical protein PybrP1_009487 [[Pythium] brassicae (nom. inval.)]|nr:hypothetical protein PybrP1_009487 [[Pythium] brassicae (nom. inval.)]
MISACSTSTLKLFGILGGRSCVAGIRSSCVVIRGLARGCRRLPPPSRHEWIAQDGVLDRAVHRAELPGGRTRILMHLRRHRDATLNIRRVGGCGCGPQPCRARCPYRGAPPKGGAAHSIALVVA